MKGNQFSYFGGILMAANNNPPALQQSIAEAKRPTIQMDRVCITAGHGEAAETIIGSVWHDWREGTRFVPMQMAWKCGVVAFSFAREAMENQK
jgi:hypothetical protein